MRPTLTVCPPYSIGSRGVPVYSETEIGGCFRQGGSHTLYCGHNNVTTTVDQHCEAGKIPFRNQPSNINQRSPPRPGEACGPGRRPLPRLQDATPTSVCSWPHERSRRCRLRGPPRRARRSNRRSRGRCIPVPKTVSEKGQRNLLDTHRKHLRRRSSPPNHKGCAKKSPFTPVAAPQYPPKRFWRAEGLRYRLAPPAPVVPDVTYLSKLSQLNQACLKQCQTQPWDQWSLQETTANNTDSSHLIRASF